MTVLTVTRDFGGPQLPRLQRGKRPVASLEAKLIKIQAPGTGAMLGLATFNLFTGVGTLANTKAVPLAATDDVAAYTVNHFRSVKGAELWRTDITVSRRQSELTKVQARIDQEASASVAGFSARLTVNGASFDADVREAEASHATQ